MSALNLRKLCIVGAVLGLAGCATTVRTEDVEGQTISEVSIRLAGPTTTGDEVRLQTYIRTTAGSRYVSERVDEDIKSLYESGLVNNVRVLAEPKKTGVELIYEVQIRGAICCGSGFAGNTVFSDERLATATELRVGQQADRPTILTAARKVEAYYHANGYPQARVSVRFEKGFGSDPNAFFVFVIEEGPGPEKRDPG